MDLGSYSVATSDVRNEAGFLSAHIQVRDAESRSIPGSELWLPAPSLAGVPVGQDTVSAFGAFYAGVYVLASDLAAIPFHLTRTLPDGTKRVDPNHWLHDAVFSSPDGRMSAISYFQTVEWHLCTRGNSYSRILRDRMLNPCGFELLDQNTVNVRLTDKRDDKGRRIVYYTVDGEPEVAEDIIHFANVGKNGYVGLSPIAQSRESLGLAIATEKAAAGFYGNGIHPGGAITYQEKYDKSKQEYYRSQLNDVHQGPFNYNKFIQLFGGATFTPVELTATDAEFLGSRQFSIEEICRILNIPPSKLHKLDKVNFATLEEVNANYYMSSIWPWVRRIESEINRKCLTREERKIWSVAHDVSQNLRGRILDEANRDKIWRDMGVTSSNEIRARHGMPPVPGGDTFLVPLNTAPMDKVAAASIETLKGVKVDPIPPGDSDEIDVTDTDQDVKAGVIASQGGREGPATASEARRMPSVSVLIAIAREVKRGLPAEAARGMISAAYPDHDCGWIELARPLAPAVVGADASPKGPDPAAVDAARDVVRDVGRRMMTRLCGKARRAIRRGDLSEVLPALDAIFSEELPTLAGAFGPACRVLSAVSGADVSAEIVAGRIVDYCKMDILRCVEGDDTIGALSRAVDRWESVGPDAVEESAFQLAGV